MRKKQQGFTLIELLTTMAIVGILAGLSVASYGRAKHIASFSLVESTMRNARTASSAGLSNDPPLLRGGIPLTRIESHEELTASPLLRAYLSGLVIPNNTVVTVEYEPICQGAGAGCIVEAIQVENSSACKYETFARFGDGSEALIELPSPENPCGGGGA